MSEAKKHTNECLGLSGEHCSCGAKEEEKKIEDMDSGEFIAHVFYNVLGGLHANEEIDARYGVLEMVEDIKQSREELRTRVAELEKELKDSEDAAGYVLHDFNELQNRLSTLEKVSEGMEKALEEAINKRRRWLRETDFEDEWDGKDELADKWSMNLADFKKIRGEK